MQRIIVTGATSMIGVALIKECIKNGVEVLAVIRRNSNRISRLPISDLLEVCEYNLDELASLRSEKTYDVFYHFAWGWTSKADRDDPVLQAKNITYTLEAVECANRLGCRKFIGAGSQAEYGRVEGVITPFTKVNPESAYGIAKYAAGRLSQKLCKKYGIIHIWSRIFSVYGRNDNEGTMLKYAIERYLKGETAKFSAATQMWDYLHETDAGKIFYLQGDCVEQNKVYCIGSGDIRQLKEYILEMGDVMGETAKFEFAEEESSIGCFGIEPDISELVKDVSFTPQISFYEGIKDLLIYSSKIVQENSSNIEISYL